MMSSKWVWMKLLFLFVLLENYYWSEGCWEQERLALLQLKTFFNDPILLIDWVEEDENSDCCEWERIWCNTTTGRVKQLDLYGTRSWDSGEWYLNASLFTPFEEIESLHVGGNYIAGCIENQGLEKLSMLSKLKHLSLELNFFNNSIMPSLNTLSSLRALSLSDNKLKGTINFKGLNKLENLYLGHNILGRTILSSLRNLSSLQTLSLRDIGFDGTFNIGELASLSNLESLYMENNRIDKFVVPKGMSKLESLSLDGNILDHTIFSSLKNLSSLRVLYLRDNRINGDFNIGELDSLSKLEKLDIENNKIDKFVVPKDYKGLRKLKTLDLGYNNLTREAFTQGLCELEYLPVLRLYNNDLRGSLPRCLANMTSLRVLDVSSNQLTGNISSSPLIHLTSIQELTLSSNHFQIPISLQPFFNHSNLKTFYAINNQFYTEVETYSSVPKFQLNSITLSGHLNGGTFPKFLYHQYDLQGVYLSHLNLTGEFPDWLLENNTNLDTLVLANNSLSGPIRMPSNSHIQLEYLDISRNTFNGSIPSAFGNMNSLFSLDLSNNELIGEIPEHLAIGCFSLEWLVLSNNNLQGRIFSKGYNLTKLLRLQLDDNNFSGEIPESLSNSSSLAGLYLSNNHLSGTIPRWLGYMSHLEDLIMSNNHLEGPIPTEFCQFNFLEILDISENNLSGSLPPCFSPLSIKQIHLAKNKLQGQLEDGIFYNSSSLVTLDFSYNYFNGIPKSIDRLSHLTYLLLSNNKFEGEIPLQLCRLNKLRVLDLSHNYLLGQIPPCLDNISLHAFDDNASTLMPNYRLSYSGTGSTMAKEETIIFTTKHMSHFYQGKPLEGMSGVDLSCNNLTGSIPSEIGYLTMIRALNLSHNSLTGTIPKTFGNFKQIESLDLSYNNLDGKIPSQVIELNTLSVFNVAYNNLSGKTPEWIAQFATFNESSYEGNPFLCGRPLNQTCDQGSPPFMSKPSTSNKEDNNLIDMDSFYITFIASYVVVLSGITIILCVNPYWR